MYKYVILAFILSITSIKAQDTITFQVVDSITSNFYDAGNWENLIKLGEKAVNQQIDYKKLRQRMGYAYFVTSDFYNAQIQYQHAYTFDKYDENTNLYLYYCALNIGNDNAIDFYAGKLSSETRKKLKISLIKIVNAIDLEYNYKLTDSDIRSNPIYYRVGVNTLLGSRINIYQAGSAYSQTVNSTVLTKQMEYYVSGNFSINASSSILLAYHYLLTDVNSDSFNGNLYYAKFSKHFGRLSLGLNGSYFTNLMGNYKQVDANIGYVLPGALEFSINSNVTGFFETNNNRLIFTQKLGIHPFKPIWLETSFILGNIKNFNDNNGLYIYNSLDPTTLRTGLTFYWKISNKISFIGNYTYDKKEITNSTINYNQHSFSGGILWKL